MPVRKGGKRVDIRQLLYFTTIAEEGSTFPSRR